MKEGMTGAFLHEIPLGEKKKEGNNKMMRGNEPEALHDWTHQHMCIKQRKKTKKKMAKENRKQDGSGG